MSEKRAPTRRVFDGSPAGFLLRSILFVFVLGIVILEFPGAREFLESPDSGIQTRNLHVEYVRSGSVNESVDLKPGDLIVAIDGETLRNHIHYRNLVARNVGFAPQMYTLQRDGAPIERSINYTALPRSLAALRFAFLLVAFAFVLVGLWVYLRRPDRLGLLFAGCCSMLAFLLTDRPSPSTPGLQLFAELLYDAVILLFPATLVHFFLAFQRRTRASREQRRRRLLVLYGIPGVLYGATVIAALARSADVPTATTLISIIVAASGVYFALYVMLSLAIFVRRYRRSDAAGKQRLRVVTVGTVAGFLPLLAVTVLSNLTGLRVDPRLESGAAICLGFIPVSYAYAILKHGAIELNLVVRRSLVYAFLSGLIIAGYYALVDVVGGIMVNELGAPDYVWAPLTMLFLAVMFAPARERIQRVVDRLFYRGEYTYKQEVYEFNRQIARRLRREDILGYFLERTTELLKPSFIAVYRQGDAGELCLETSQNGPDELPERVPTDSFLGRYFSRFRSPLLVEYLDRPWERRRVDKQSRRILMLPNLSVCLPLRSSDGLNGLLLLGSRLSQQPYRRADAELLETFAEQLSLVLENAELVESSLEQERLRSEVMLARDIQLSMLPDSPPDWPGIAVRGQTVSSYEMGGDYFDYFPVDDDRLAICVGDVSGKGIPAAMLMSSIRAVFKNAVLKSKLPPAEMNAQLNDFVWENAKEEQFATFFYGVFDTKTSTMSFSNAGQCPALLVKDGYVDRLSEGGLILGVRPRERYTEGLVSLDAGDLLLLYTDGITEQKNASGEEFGEERLIEFLRANKNLPLPDLQDALLQAVLAFGAGDQQDDITSVFACRLAA